MRNLLQDDLCMVISKHSALNEQIKAEIALVLAQYEISKRIAERWHKRTGALLRWRCLIDYLRQ